MCQDSITNELLAREFSYRRIFKGLVSQLIEDKIVDFNFIANEQYNDLEKSEYNFFDMIVETEECYIYVVIKIGNIKNKQELYKKHYELYKKLRYNHVNTLHINLVYGEADKDYTIQKINTDFGDSKYIFEVADINMDKLASNYHETNRGPTKEELEFLKEIGSKFVYEKNSENE